MNHLYCIPVTYNIIYQLYFNLKSKYTHLKTTLYYRVVFDNILTILYIQLILIFFFNGIIPENIGLRKNISKLPGLALLGEDKFFSKNIKILQGYFHYTLLIKYFFPKKSEGLPWWARGKDCQYRGPDEPGFLL